MSNKSNTSNQQKNTGKKATKQQKLVRGLCLFLALLMVLSCVSVLVYVFGNWKVAAATSDLYDHNLIAVGLQYGNDATVGFDLSTTNGFVVHKSVITASVRSTEPLYSLTENHVSIVIDGTLGMKDGKYCVYSSGTVMIGGYHLQIRSRLVDVEGVKVPQRLDIEDEAGIRELVKETEGLCDGMPYMVIPSYISNAYAVRIGDFSSYDNAKRALDAMPSLSAAFEVEIVSPSTTGVSVVAQNRVLFEYDCGTTSELGLAPATAGEYSSINWTNSTRLYGGTIVFNRYRSGSLDVVQVINLIDFEEYVTCVVPWEISSTWNDNALSAFSIVVRTYGAMNKFSYGKYGFDLTDGSASQVYGGYTRVTDNVIAAVKKTKGEALYYNGNLASIYYSSSQGGYTVSNTDVWGSKLIPYLAGQKTPWENYADRTNGLWYCEVSPSELAKSLRATSACASLTSPIAAVKINSTAGESGYVTSVTFTDEAGHTATVGPTTSKVKSALSEYLYSANFVVGRGSVNYTYDIIKTISVDGEGTQEFEEMYPDLFDKFTIGNYSVMTGTGKEVSENETLLVLTTQNGRFSVTVPNGNVLTAERYHALKDKNVKVDSIYTTASASSRRTSTVYLTTDLSVNLETVSRIREASAANNFVFAGKGWGHGVGMSQFGMCDLANIGMSGEQILEKYFPGTNVQVLR